MSEQGGLGDLTYKDDHRHQTGPGTVTYHVEVQHGRRREDAVTPESGPLNPPYLHHPVDKTHVQVAVESHGKTLDEMDQEAHRTAYDMASSTSPHDMVTKTRILHVEAALTCPQGHAAEMDPVDGLQHLDGSVAQDCDDPEAFQKVAMTEDDHDAWEHEVGGMDRYKPRTWHEELHEAYDHQRIHEDLQEEEHWMGYKGEERHARENGYQRSNIADFAKGYGRTAGLIGHTRFVHVMLPEDPHEAHDALLSAAATAWAPRTAAPVNPPGTSDYDKNRLHDLVTQGGFTSHPWRNSPRHGFMASLDSTVAPGAVHHINSITPEHIAAHRASIAKHLLHPGVFQGGWHDTHTGDVYLDTSSHFQSEHNARNFALQHKQKAYYNLGTGQEHFLDPHADPQKHSDPEGWKAKYAKHGYQAPADYESYRHLYEPKAVAHSASKDPRFDGVALKEDDDGWYVSTHRARSDSYDSPEKIPAKKVEFIRSTGGKHDPWYATASDAEIDAHPAAEQIRSNLAEHTAPNGSKYRLVSHKHFGYGRMVVAHQMSSGRRVGALSWFGGKKTEGDSISGTIHKVVVSGPHRRKGLASAMLDHARATHPDDDIEHSHALTEDGKAWAQKKAAYDKSWRPHERLFGPCKDTEDPRLFADHKMLPDVREHLVRKMDGFMDKHGWEGWSTWARMYLAGSEASLWWGNNDFDILVGVDYDAFRETHNNRLSDEEITDDFNKAFRADWNDENWRPPFDGEVWHLTGYVNADSYDIRKIKPYAAYDVVHDDWAVHPVHVPKDWGPDKLPDSVWHLAEQYADEIDRISTLHPPSVQQQQAQRLYDHIHDARSKAFGPSGSGVFDSGNVAEKYLDQRPDHPLALLVEMKNQGKEQKTAALTPDVPLTDLGHKVIDPWTERHLRKMHPESTHAPGPKTFPIEHVWGGQSYVDRDPDWQRNADQDRDHPPTGSMLPNGHVMLQDGHHRLADAKERGDTHFTVHVEGTGYGSKCHDPMGCDFAGKSATASAEPNKVYRGLKMGGSNYQNPFPVHGTDEEILEHFHKTNDWHKQRNEVDVDHPLSTPYGRHWTSDHEQARRFATDQIQNLDRRPGPHGEHDVYGAVIEAHTTAEPKHDDFKAGYGEKEVQRPHRKDLTGATLHIHVRRGLVDSDRPKDAREKRENTYVRSIPIPDHMLRTALRTEASQQTVFHGTSVDGAKGIIRDGMRPGAWVADHEEAKRWAGIQDRHHPSGGVVIEGTFEGHGHPLDFRDEPGSWRGGKESGATHLMHPSGNIGVVLTHGAFKPVRLHYPDGRVEHVGQHTAKKDAKKDEYEPPTVSGIALRAADTGRLLMIQRSLKDEKDPAAGTWEFPGGHHEDGDKTSLHAGIREWEEEVGHPFPEGGTVTHTWRTGPYQGHMVVVPKEECVDFSGGRRTTNPDDPDNDDHEQAAWWDPEHARKNPALRQECKDNWSSILPGLKAAASLGPEYSYEHVVHQPKFGSHYYGDKVPHPTPEQVYNAGPSKAFGGAHIFEHRLLHKGVPVAKLRYSVHPDEPHVLNIEGLAVHPDHQSKGLAFHLADHMQHHAESVGGVIDHGTYTDQGHAFAKKYMASDNAKPHLHLPYPDKPTGTTGAEFMPHMLDPHEMQAGSHGRGASKRPADWVVYAGSLEHGWWNDAAPKTARRVYLSRV